MSTQNTVSAQSDQSISNIDAATNAALAAAQARKNAKKSGTAAGSTPEGQPAGEAKKRTVKTPEQRLEEAKQREEDRAARKAKRIEERDARWAAKPAPEPAHMKKVAKAAERLPALDEVTQSFLDDAKANFSPAQLEALSAHIAHFCRASATADASKAKLAEGQTVKIMKGASAKYIGAVGTVSKVQRIRCFVTLPGQEKPIYLFSSDVEPCEAPAADSAAA